MAFKRPASPAAGAIAVAAVKKDQSFQWDLVDSRHWRIALRRLHPLYSGVVRRVYPGTEDYHKAVLMRYESLVEQEYADPENVRIEALALESDSRNIILGFFRLSQLKATLTLRKVPSGSSAWLHTSLGACEKTGAGIKAMELLLDTAEIICMGMKLNGLLGLVPRPSAETFLPSGFMMVSDANAELQAIAQRLAEEITVEEIKGQKAEKKTAAGTTAPTARLTAEHDYVCIYKPNPRMRTTQR